MRIHNCICHVRLSYLTQLSCHVQLRANVIWKDSYSVCCMNIYAAHGTVITHTVRRTEIPAQLDSWVKDTPSVKTCPLKIAGSSYLHKKKPAQVLVCRGFTKFVLSPVKLCGQCITTTCSFMCDMPFKPLEHESHLTGI